MCCLFGCELNTRQVGCVVTDLVSMCQFFAFLFGRLTILGCFRRGKKDEKTQNQQKLKQNIIIYTHIERYKKLCHGVSFFFLSFFLSLEQRQWFGCLPYTLFVVVNDIDDECNSTFNFMCSMCYIDYCCWHRYLVVQYTL